MPEVHAKMIWDLNPDFWINPDPYVCRNAHMYSVECYGILNPNQFSPKIYEKVTGKIEISTKLYPQRCII